MNDPLPTQPLSSEWGGGFPTCPLVMPQAILKVPGDTAVMLPFTPIETPEALVVRLDNPERFNDFRSDAYRESLYHSVLSKEEPLVALDLSPLDYLSSTGIAILVGLKRRVEAQRGKLVLFRAQPIIHDLLRGMKLDTYFSIVECEHEALELLRPAAAV